MNNKVLDPTPEPGSKEWFKYMTGSKIASVIGLSPWNSKYALWHQMAGLVEKQAVNDAMMTGHYLEPSVFHWLSDQYPELVFKRSQAFYVKDGWMGATPDGLTVTPNIKSQNVEVKTSKDYWEKWGKSGTEDIPPYYYAQVQWQMLVTECQVTYVGVLVGGLEFKKYEIQADPVNAEYLVREAKAFMESLPAGINEKRPDIDSSNSTYQTIIKMHPEIDGSSIDLPLEVVSNYLETKTLAEQTASDHKQAKNTVLELMGKAKIGEVLGTPHLRRQSNGKGISLHTCKGI